MTFENNNELKLQKMKSLYNEFDQMIKRGESSQVFNLCKSINSSEIPRNLLVEFAEIARRIGQPQLMIRWLRPIVRSEKPAHPPVSIMELTTYTQGLIRLGGFNEAQRMIETILKHEGEKTFEQFRGGIYFMQASLFVMQWKYKKAIPFFKKHRTLKSVEGYQKVVSTLNLIAAYSAIGDFKKSIFEINRLEPKLIKNNATGQFTLILGNLNEVKSQVMFLLKNYSEALLCLDKANQLLKRADKRSLLYVAKWKTLIELAVSDSDNKIIYLNQLREIQLQSKLISDYETVREIDFQYALFTKNIDMFLKVYWGSRQETYRKRILKIFTDELNLNPKEFIQKSFNYPLFKQEEISRIVTKNFPTVDLLSNVRSKLVRKLFALLTREFYRPLRLIELFDELYPDEYFNPKSTPEKIHKLINYARIFITKNKYPIEIKNLKVGFQIVATQPCYLVIQNSNVDSNNKKLEFKLSPELQTKREFTIDEFINYHSMPERTARNTLKKLIESKKIKKLNFRKKSTFKFL